MLFVFVVIAIKVSFIATVVFSTTCLNTLHVCSGVKQSSCCLSVCLSACLETICRIKIFAKHDDNIEAPQPTKSNQRNEYLMKLHILPIFSLS